MIDFHMLVTRDINTIEENKLVLNGLGFNLNAINNRGFSTYYGRSKAYEESNKEFVSFIDDDDCTLLTQSHIEYILNKNTDALFTNSIHKTYVDWITLSKKDIKEYSQSDEKKGLLCPHQTMVIRTRLALDIVKEAKRIMDLKGWQENKFDIVFRLLISQANLWHYYPEITYKWIKTKGSLHYSDIQTTSEIRKYFTKGFSK